MTALAPTHLDARQARLATVRLLGSGCVGVGVLLSGFVLDEPAPYELWLAGLIGIWFLLGLKISRAVAPLLVLFFMFNVGGILSLTQMRDLTRDHLDGPVYMAVSTFLALTAVFYAAIIEDRHSRLRLIFRMFTLAGLLTATFGILGYFHAVPGTEIFTRYDRAMGAFQDPNVFGPYLVAPALYLMHGILVGDLKAAPLRALGVLILALGIFLSFSRAAWALFGFTTVALIFFMLLKYRSDAFRLRIFMLSLAALALLTIALLAALQYHQVSNLFSARTQLVQDYDGGHLGRFERHRLGFLLSMEHPLGIGPLVFNIRFLEDEHNIYLKSLTTYGWLGFICWISMICWTIYIGFRNVLKDRPWQSYLMIAWIGVLGHAGIGFVIDTDHWRHFYLLIGIVWGCAALEWRHQRRLAPTGQREPLSTR